MRSTTTTILLVTLTWGLSTAVAGQPASGRLDVFQLSTEVTSGYPCGVEGEKEAVTVHRTGSSNGEVSIDYYTVDGTARARDDYEPIAGTLTFADGQWQGREVSVPILDDQRVESHEHFGLQLTDPSGGEGLIGPTAAAIVVFDNDFGPLAAGPKPAGPPFRPGDNGAWSHRTSDVAVANNGDFMVAWQGRDEGEPGRVFARFYDPQGVAMGPPVGVSTGSGSRPAVAAGPEGDFVVVWNDWNAIYARRFNRSGTAIGDEIRIASAQTPFHSLGAPQVARLGGGNDVVVWAVYLTTSVAWPAATLIGPDGVPLTDGFSPLVEFCWPLGLAVAAAPAGSFVVTCGGSGQLWAQQFNAAGEPEGAGFRVDTPAAGSLSNPPAIAVDAVGNFTIVWGKEDAGRVWSDVHGRRYGPAGTPLGEPFLVNVSRAFDQSWPAVASDAAGNFTVVWQSDGQDGSGNGIFGQRFDARGHRVGGEFLVNTTTLGNQQRPAVASDSLGNLVVVWEQEEADGRFDVVAQRYASWTCAPGPTTLCLGRKRFRIEVAWEDFAGHTGQGQAMPLTTDTGTFWFFDNANVELVVKVLDGTAVNGHYWVFYGALSNVEYTITVTDTATDRVKVYFNPLGEFGSHGDAAAFPEPKGTALATH